MLTKRSTTTPKLVHDMAGESPLGTTSPRRATVSEKDEKSTASYNWHGIVVSLAALVKVLFPTMSLDHQQKQVQDYILEKIGERSPGNCYTYITGFAGTGKTYLLNSLIDSLPQNCSPIVLTWTGTAARQLHGGETLMAFCGLSFAWSGLVGDNSYMRCREELHRRMVTYLKRKRIFDNTRQVVVIIDEVVALHDVVLDSLQESLLRVRSPMSSQIHQPCHLEERQ